jgi:hypothetical protein
MAITREALWNKAKVFLDRAIACRDGGELAEFQLWAIMALEVLAKAALAHTHPTLVADPMDFESLLAAVGASKSTQFKTIQAKTLFPRCKRLIKGFDDTCERFCLQMAQDRNAEIHSGAVPFQGVPLEAWQSRYWFCVKVLTEGQGMTLDDLLGKEEAAAAEAIIKDANEAITVAVKGRISRARAGFETGRSKDERGHIAAAARIAVEAQLHSTSVEQECPACGCVGVLSGEQVDEEVGEASDDEPWMHWVTLYVSAEHFHCVACKLRLDGQQELEAAEVGTEFETEALQELHDDEDYGND